MQPAFFIQLFENSLKVAWEHDNPPALPSGCAIPAEDIDIVRTALISHPKFVTADHELLRAINSCEALHLRAITPADAIALAQDK